MKYLILQNTMAPYRISLFNKLFELGLDFEVLYMCEMESYRSWSIDKSIIKYKYSIANGYKGKVLGTDFYWCPQFINRFIKEKNIKIILGGSWNFADVVVSCILKRFHVIKNEIIFWSEANYLTIGARKKNKLRDLLRSFVFNSGEGRIIVPGQMAIETFTRWGIKNKNFILLPNVIEEEKFKPIVNRSNYNESINSGENNFILPVRLNEKIKGVINFFSAIGKENIEKCHFFVLGNGPDELMTREYVERNSYGNNIEILGFCQMDKVIEFYAKSDVLVLPSFSDPSPLSLVEACCCSMPILASDRCGNHFETIKDGQNGYTFSPDNHKQIKAAFETLLGNREKWGEMGKGSRQLFESNFQQSVVLPKFIKQLNA